jgi:hypothetical protein
VGPAWRGPDRFGGWRYDLEQEILGGAGSSSFAYPDRVLTFVNGYLHPHTHHALGIGADGRKVRIQE